MNTYLRILSFVKPYWKHLIVSFVFTILFAVLSGVSIYLTIPLLDTLFQESSNKNIVINQSTGVESAAGITPDFIENIKNEITTSFNNYILSGEKTDILIKICILIVASFLFKNIFGYMQAYFMAHVEFGAMRDLRDKAYIHLNKLSLSYFKKERVGNLISMFTNDVNVVQSSISATFSNLIQEPMTILVFFGIALSISWQLTMLAILIVPLSTYIIVWIGQKLRKQTEVLQSKLADITSVLQESISGVKIVKAFGMEKYENKKFMQETTAYFKLALKIVRTRNSSSPITEILSVIIGAIIIYYGGLLVLIENTISASQFMGFLFAIFQMMPPIKALGGVNNRIQEASAAADRIFAIMDKEPSIKSKDGAQDLLEFKHNIRFENVSFHYEESRKKVLKNVNVQVNKGDILALVGPSGGGKSTLVDLVPRFYDPTEGRILIDSVDIKDIKLDSLRSKMGIVTQETFLFNGSIKQNIAYGLENSKFEKIVEVSKSANAHDFIVQMPQEYDTLVGERGVRLSGGQRQRITIARALLKNPQILIFDEATSALDSESEILVQQAIERLMVNRTTFVIAHRLSTIRNATNILVIDNGKVVQVGKHEDLIADTNGLYKKLYAMQFRDHLPELKTHRNKTDA